MIPFRGSNGRGSFPKDGQRNGPEGGLFQSPNLPQRPSLRQLPDGRIILRGPDEGTSVLQMNLRHAFQRERFISPERNDFIQMANDRGNRNFVFGQRGNMPFVRARMDGPSPFRDENEGKHRMLGSGQSIPNERGRFSLGRGRGDAMPDGPDVSQLQRDQHDSRGHNQMDEQHDMQTIPGGDGSRLNRSFDNSLPQNVPIRGHGTPEDRTGIREFSNRNDPSIFHLRKSSDMSRPHLFNQELRSQSSGNRLPTPNKGVNVNETGSPNPMRLPVPERKGSLDTSGPQHVLRSAVSFERKDEINSKETKGLLNRDVGGPSSIAQSKGPHEGAIRSVPNSDDARDPPTNMRDNRGPLNPTNANNIRVMHGSSDISDMRGPIIRGDMIGHKNRDDLRGPSTFGDLRGFPNRDDMRDRIIIGDSRAPPNRGDMRGPPNMGDMGGPPNMGDMRMRGTPNKDEMRGLPNRDEMRSHPNRSDMRGPPNMIDMRGPPNMDDMRGPLNRGDVRGPPNMGDSRGPLNRGVVRGPPNMGDSRGTPNKDEMRGPPTRGDMRGPSNVDDIRGPPSMSDMRGPTNMDDMRGPQRMGDMRGPSNMDDMRGPQNMGDKRGPSSMGDMRVPTNMGDSRGPLNRGVVRGPPIMGDMRGPQRMGDMRGPPNVDDIRGPPSMSDVRGPPNMGDMRGPPNMGDMRGPTNMSDMRGPPNMGDMRGPSNMSNVRGPPNMGDMRGPPNMGDIRGPPNMGDMRGPPNMGDIRGPPNVGDIRGPPSMSDMRGPTNMDDMRGPQRMGDMRGPSNMGDMRGPTLSRHPNDLPMHKPRLMEGGPERKFTSSDDGYQCRESDLFEIEQISFDGVPLHNNGSPQFDRFSSHPALDRKKKIVREYTSDRETGENRVALLNAPDERLFVKEPPSTRPGPTNKTQESLMNPPLHLFPHGLPPPESISGRKTLLSTPLDEIGTESQTNDSPVQKKGILPPPEIIAKSVSSGSLLSAPCAEISKPPSELDEKDNRKENSTATKNILPHPSSILPTPEAVSAMKEPVQPTESSQKTAEIGTPTKSSDGEKGGIQTVPSSNAPSSTSMVPLHLPPPQILPSSTESVINPMNFIPPASVNAIPLNVPPPIHADFSCPPPIAHPIPPSVAAPVNTGSIAAVPHDLSMPPPAIASASEAGAATSLPPLHLPPPGYDNSKPKEGVGNESSQFDFGDEEYLRELKEWHKQIETYEQQMVEYFQKCRDRLMEIYPADPNTADPAIREAYQKEYEKLQQEYQNFTEYMQPMREHYAEVTAQMEKEEQNKASTAGTDISLALPPPMPEQEPPPPPPPPTEAAPTEPPSDPSNNSLAQLAENYGGEAEGDDASIPAAQYYSQYYRQMIDYYQQLLKTMQGEDANGSSSGDTTDEEMKNLNKNQRKKLRKKKMKKKMKDSSEPSVSAKNQPPPPPPETNPPNETQLTSSVSSSGHQWQDWSAWYGYQAPVGPQVWAGPPVDVSMLGTGMEWQEVPRIPPPPSSQPSVINQQVALTNKQLMDHPKVADGVAGYGANIPLPPQEPPMRLEDVDGMTSVGVGSEPVPVAGLQPHMSAVLAHVQAMAGLPDVSVPPPPPLAQAQPGSIFTEEDQQEEKKKDGSGTKESEEEDDDDDDDDDGDWSFCPTCDQKFTTERAYTVHLRGVKHMQNALENAQKKDPDKFKEEREAELVAIKKEEDPEKKHVDWMIQQSVKRRGLGSMGSFFCELCNVECTSEKALAMHLNGTKHALRVDQLKSGTATLSSLQAVEEKRVVRKRAQLRIQTVLDQCLEALIGLNYISEYQRQDTMAECRYHCQLCDFRFSPKTFMTHLTGMKHRKNFMKYNYSDMYEILDQDSSMKVVRIKRIDTYARKIEEYEGRKRLSIKTEITDEGRKKEAKRERLEKEFHEQQQAEAAAEAKAKAAKKAGEEKEAEAARRAHQLEVERRRRHEEQRRKEHEARRRAAALQEAERKRRLRKESRLVRQRAKAAANARKKNKDEEDDDAELEEGEIASDSSLTDGEIIEAQDLSPLPDRRNYDSGYPSAFTEDFSSDDERHRPTPRPVRPPERMRSTIAPVKKKEVVVKKEENEDEEEVGLDEEQDVEYEDAYVSERPPMTFQVKEEPERDEFIRTIKEKKMLRLKEVTPEALKQFAAEADWVLARKKKEDDAKKAEMAEEKRRRLEQLRKDEASVLPKTSLAKIGLGGRASNRLGLLLPELGQEAGPARQPSQGLVQPQLGQPLPQASDQGAGVPLAPPNPALQMLMKNYQQLTGLGLQPPPPPRDTAEKPEQLAQLISTMKTMMQKLEARPARPGLLMPPAPKKPPSLFPLTKRRRLLGQLLPEAEEEEAPAAKRPAVGGLLPHPTLPGQRRTLLEAPPSIPQPKKPLLGERPPPEPPAAPTSKKVLIPAGPPAHEPPDEEEEEEPRGRRLRSVVAVPMLASVPAEEEASQEEKMKEEKADASDTVEKPDEKEEEVEVAVVKEGEEKPVDGQVAMEEGELEDDEEEEVYRRTPPRERFFDGYSLWRPPGPGGPGMHPHRPPFMGHMGFGPRRRPMDDEDHLRELMKKPDFRIHPMRRMGPGRNPAPGPPESRNLTAIAKLLGLNEPRPQRPPPPAAGKLPEVDVNQLKAILTHVHQQQRPGSSQQGPGWRRQRSDPKTSKPPPTSDKL